VPSSAHDAFALLHHAIADPDPVVFLEPKARYWVKEEVDVTADEPGIGQGRVLRDGDDVAIVSYGAMVARALKAADELVDRGIEARVIDLRSLSPLDDGILQVAAEDTGRIVVVHEAPRHVGVGAEVAARVMELAFDSLAAPVQRVTGWDTPYPPASLEDGYLPSVERIVEAAERAVKY
jgi:pyruvate dehydrogenase E1 component beta subunit